MLQVTINGTTAEFSEGTTILQALQKLQIKVPALCDDPRLEPIGACRLCVVSISGVSRPVTACNTFLTNGMAIQTHTAEINHTRRTNLNLLVGHYANTLKHQISDDDFHRTFDSTLKHVSFGASRPELLDDSHPYIHVDMSRCIYCFRCVRICEDLQGQFVWRVWNRGEATRILPDSETTLLESSCVSCGACSDTCPTGALEDKSVLKFGAALKWTRTTCPYCGVGCEMNVGTRDDRIVQVKPIIDAPVNKGHLCVKGRYAFDFVNSRDRITDPMLRQNGEWKKCTWDDAITAVATGFRRALEEFGPGSIGVLGSARATNEENYLAQKFARVVLGTNNVDCCARVCHAPTAAAMKIIFGTGAATNSFDDIENARTILLCGSNATENHPIVGARIKQARLHGARLIVIDPRKIELAEYADLHLPLRPGTNVALFNALAHVIVQEKLYDLESVRDRIDGWEMFSAFVRSWTPERAAAICGVDAETIRQAARLYATNKPSICFHGLGMTEHVQGTEGVMALVNLSLITGNFGKPGTGINPLRGQNNVQGAAHMGCEPSNLTGFVPIDKGHDDFEKVWRTQIPRRPGLNLLQMVDAARDQKLKALWAIGYDVALTNPDAVTTCDALRSVDLLIVQDMFLNEIAQFGNVFLPVASSFEKDGTFMNAERRVQRVRKALEPPGNCRPDWKIICDLAAAMGFREFFNFNSPKEIWDEIRTVWKVGRGITYERLEDKGLQWPCLKEDDPGTAVLHRNTFPMGRKAPVQTIEFRPTQEMTSKEFPFLLTTGRTLYQFNAGTMTMHTRNTILRPKDCLDISPADAAALPVRDNEEVAVISRYGATALPVKVNPAVKPGELFATFHTAQAFLNRVTNPARDKYVSTPEYKVTAVRLEKPTGQPMEEK